MALRAVPDHPKFTALRNHLKANKATTLGYLECIWHFTAKFCPQGNIGKFDDQAIEGWCEWDGQRGDLIEALLDNGWLDRDETHRLVVHDWHEYADATVKKHISRSGKAFVGTPTANPMSRPVIYFIRSEGTNLVKIGFTEGHASGRLAALQIGNPNKLSLAFFYPASQKEEMQLHKRFAAHRQQGEWFIFHEDIRAHMVSFGWLPTAANGGLPVPEPVPVPVPVPAPAPEPAFDADMAAQGVLCELSLSG